MPGSILKLFMPITHNSLLFGVYDYLLPIMLYCAWSTLAFLDLARANDANHGRTWRWSAVILAFPLAGAAGYLLFGGSAMSRTARVAVVAGGIAVAAAAFGYTWIRIS
jgi:uncharacterized membrane-anchored protein